MKAKKIKILIKSDGSYLDTILPPITANEDGRTIVQVIAPFPITDIVSVNYSIRPIQATVKGSYLLPTGKFGKDVLDEDYTHFQTVADWNVFEIPINAVALEYISKYRAGLVLVSFTIKQLQTPYFATNYLGLFSDTNPIPTTSYNDGDYFIANEYNFTAHDITWAKGDYAYFYNGKWNKGKSVLKASTPSIELPVDPSLKDAPQLEYDEDVALLLANDLGLLTQRVSQSETDIESAENDINEIDGRVGVNETDIYNLESDVDDLETEIGNIKDGTTIVKKAEQDSSGNVITSTYETKIDATNKLATKVDKTQKIIGIDLQDDILLTEFKTALGNATQSVAGLLSAEDKTHLDGLVALLENSNGNTVVDTIGEILAIFNNYPEGADLFTALNGKVDKVAGKGLSQNNFTDALKNKLDGLLNGSQYYDKTYIDALKDQNGWKSQLLTLTPLAPNGTIATATLLLYNTLKLQVKNTSTSFVDTDSVEVSLGVVTGNKIQLSDTSVYLEIGATNSTFVAPTGWELQIVGLKYTELKAIDTTYDNTVSEMTATTVQGAIDELENEIDGVETAIINITNVTTDIKGTKQVPTFNVNGDINKLEHISLLTSEVLRTDTFEYSTGLITETRVLQNGSSLILKYDLINLETEVI